MMYSDLFKGTVVLVYPNNQRENPDMLLSCLKDFKAPSQLLGKHATTVEIVWQTKEQTRLREIKVPQRIDDFELFFLSQDTQYQFTQLKEIYYDFLRDTEFDHIIKLYYTFDGVCLN